MSNHVVSINRYYKDGKVFSNVISINNNIYSGTKDFLYKISL